MLEYHLGIHIPLPRPAIRKIHRLRKVFSFAKKYRSYYRLIPHITLHLARLNPSDFDPLYRSLEGMPKKPFFVSFASLHCDMKTQRVPVFISQKIHRSRSLLFLHEKIVRKTNILRRDLIRAKDLERMKKGMYTKKEIAHIRKYGYLLVMKNFFPHISLGAMTGDISFSEKQRVRKIVRKHASVLRGEKFFCDHIIVGLYTFDTVKGDFVNSKKIERVLSLTTS